MGRGRPKGSKNKVNKKAVVDALFDNGIDLIDELSKLAKSNKLSDSQRADLYIKLLPYVHDKKSRINGIIEIIRNKKEYPLDTNLGVFGFLFSHVLFKKVYNDSQKHILDSVLWINESCKQCGTCQKICPVNNIELTGSGPKWLGKCVNCARCYHMCPNKAIEFGNDSMERYKNPDIKLEELI